MDNALGFPVPALSGSLFALASSIGVFRFSSDGIASLAVPASNGVNMFGGSRGTVASQSRRFAGGALLNTITDSTVNGGTAGWTAVSQVALKLNRTQVVIAPVSVGFGDQLVGWPSGLQTITMTNTGDKTLTISGIAIAGDFIMWKTTCGARLRGGQSCTMRVSFRPRMPGARFGTIAIKDSAPDSPQTVNLTGRGTMKSKGIY
jgi:hypothetical protein